MTKRPTSTDAGKSASRSGGRREDRTMTDDAKLMPLYWGPGGPPRIRELVDSWTPGRDDDATWGPYHAVLFPPRRTTPWISYKIMSTGRNVARRLWEEREDKRREYEAVHGAEPEFWPTRHPGVVLESVLWVAHSACLGCRWLDRKGTYMRIDGWRVSAMEAALAHQESPL
jgi:hypothetical protein